MQRIGFIVFPGFSVMICAVITAFELANREMSEPVYDVRLLSETGGSIRASIGMSVVTDRFGRADFDTLITGRRPETPDPGLIKVCAPGFRAMPAGRRDLHRSVHPGRSRSTRRPTREHALEARARAAVSIPKSEGGGRPHLHHRRPGVDLGRDDRGYRPRAGYD